jgi:diaminohydroxyphosphoribosylaminopyrimidine deaminase/5-amino-6-(5-phosphoribosylamino)uracil reductase
MVGAVLVHEERIIGQGYHHQYGQAHAEVNCIENVSEQDKHLVATSILYVSLEPCNHFGKTPPCTDLILKHKIQKVVVGCIDPFSEVAGRGIFKLREADVEIVVEILQKECEELNRRFFTFHLKQRPYIILKWAQSSNQKIASKDDARVLISNDLSNRLVHKWRSEEAAIMVGTNTALLDNPSLNVRLWNGKNPVRLIIDLDLRLPSTLNIFNHQQPTIIFNNKKGLEEENLAYHKLSGEGSMVNEVLTACYKLNIQSILIEGGTKLLQSLINQNLWDEARIIQNNQLVIPRGLQAPELLHQQLLSVDCVSNDSISYYKNSSL